MNDPLIEEIEVYLERLKNPTLAEEFRREINKADTKQRKIIVWELENHNKVMEYYDEERKKGAR